MQWLTVQALCPPIYAKNQTVAHQWVPTYSLGTTDLEVPSDCFWKQNAGQHGFVFICRSLCSLNW